MTPRRWSVGVGRRSLAAACVVAVSSIACDGARVAVEPEQAFGSLHVVSDPAGARISLDDVDTGRSTPATLEEVALGEHVVGVELPGYGPATRTAVLDTDGQTEVVSFDLDVLCPGDNVLGDPARGPSVSITGLAPGDRSVAGTVSNVDLGATDHRVVLWAKTDHWYVQPYIAAPWTAVCGDGSWRNGTHPWDRMVAVLVDADAFGTPPAVLYLHPALRSGVLAWTEFPQPRVIDFAGYRWLVKASDTYRVGPGPNLFSAATSDIWKDEQGRVHLTTSEHDGTWWSTEIVMEEHLGYGEYRFTLDSRVDSLDYGAVFAGFIYESLDQEIDVEFSQTLADPDNAQYVVQPYTRAGNVTRYEIGDAETSTHRMLWLADGIMFDSWLGDAPEPTPETLVNSWSYTGVDVPVPDDERMRFNLWLFNGAAPASGVGDEVIVRSFAFTPR